MKGFIYKIINEDSNNIYIGSTKQTLKQRYYVHKSKKKKSYCSSEIIINGLNPSIILLEEIEFIDRKDLLNKEKYYINIYLNDKNYKVVNIRTKPNRTKQEAYEYSRNKYKDYMKDYAKEFYNNNKSYFSKKVNCPQCNKQMNYSSLSNHKKRCNS